MKESAKRSRNDGESTDDEQAPGPSKGPRDNLKPATKRRRQSAKKPETRVEEEDSKNAEIKPDVKSSKKPTGKPRTQWSRDSIDQYPPIVSIERMFEDITQRNEALKDVAVQLDGRSLRVATMCSGTESPVLALKMISDAMEKLFKVSLHIEHVFSCEIEPFKQAYIERNFQPPLLFRDVCELGEEEATTAYGAKVKVPGDCDMLVAGTSCVDYSSLNNYGKGLNDGGQSGRTFWGMFAWVKKHRPKIIILENVCKAPWNQVAQEFENISYATCHTKLDTKNYYIPHTRQRGYLVAFDSNNEALPEAWANLVHSLTRPASTSFDDFLLDSNDPRITNARQKLNKEEMLKPKSHEWHLCAMRHAVARANENLGHGRPVTDWHENGSIEYPDHSWQDWGANQVERVNDLIDISYNRNAKAGVDVLYKNRLWNLSQNVDRNIEGNPWGIAQCLTPTMIPFHTSRCGPLVGAELLSLQGIPVEKLLLTRETEANLKDLAGNAMTSTVVGTAMVAALICGKDLLGIDLVKRSDFEKSSHKSSTALLEPSSGSFENRNIATSTNHCPMLLHVLGMLSSRSCICDGQSSVSAYPLTYCEECGHRFCPKCSGKPKHHYDTYSFREEILGLPSGDFSSPYSPLDYESDLKSVIPMIVNFEHGAFAVEHSIMKTMQSRIKEDNWEIWRHCLENALGSTFRYKTTKRRASWIVIYESDFGRLELILGMTGIEWHLFIENPRESEQWSLINRFSSRPAARMIVDTFGTSLVQGIWEIGVPVFAKLSVRVEGGGVPIDSWERTLGLDSEDLANKMVWSKLNLMLEDPSESILLSEQIEGDWNLLTQCGTAKRALHKKEIDADVDPGKGLFLFLDPSPLGGSEADSFVISKTCERMERNEHRLVVGKLSADFYPDCNKQVTMTQMTIDTFWVSVQELQIAQENEFFVDSKYSSISEIVHQQTCSTAAPFFVVKCDFQSELFDLSQSSWSTVGESESKDFFNNIAWLIGKRNFNFIDWCPLPVTDEENCLQCAPTKPASTWEIGKRDKLVENPEDAAVWEIAMKNRPHPWVTAWRRDSLERLEVCIGLDLRTLSHRVASLLPQGSEMGPLTIDWRISTDYSNPPRPYLAPFQIPSNSADPENQQPEGFLVSLRPEQLRSLTWMMEREQHYQFFNDEEVIEAVHPGLGWKCDVRASRRNFSRGGVLADAVGYGKTATMLGLIAATRHLDLEDGPKERIVIKATLIIVPAHLVGQWQSEVEKFTGDMFNVLTIKTMTQLVNFSIKDVMKADIIIVASSLLKSDLYWQRMAEFSGGPDSPVSGGRRFQDWLKDSTGRLLLQLDHLRAGRSMDVQRIITDGCQERARVRMLKQRKDGEGDVIMAESSMRPVEGESSTNPPEDQAPKVKEDKKGKGKGKAADAYLMEYDDKRWNITRDWTDMRCPPLEIFYFKRIVVDEFTYCTGMPLEVIPNLLASCRWVLSGTPPMGDFADVKKIAKFLRVRLGRDDDLVNSEANNKQIAKERTAVESFQAFQEAKTATWHLERQSKAQEFINVFMRQNIPEIGEIRWAQHFEPIQLPATERAIYVELDHHLRALDMHVAKRKRGKGTGDREIRLKSAIGNSQTAEEALLKCVSHFSLNISDLPDDANATTACSKIVKERKTQLDDLEKAITQNLRDAYLLLGQVQPDKRSDLALDKYLQDKKATPLEDAEATNSLRTLLQDAISWAGSPANKKTMPHIVVALSAPKDKGKGKSQREKQDEDVEEGAKSEIKPEDFMKILQSKISRLLKELVARYRSLRFFNVVREAQKLPGGVSRSWRDSGCMCGESLNPDTVMVSSTCGHTSCKTCMLTCADTRNQCPEKRNGCGSRLTLASLIPLQSLRVGDDHITKHGAKLEHLVHMINTKIPRDERVLVFVQFSDLSKKVASVLEAAGIPVKTLDGNASARSDRLTEFQQEDSKARVLLLEAMGESASGANLTVANHVVFVSPLSAPSDATFDAAETQAIGRVYRYGQKKTVHVWRLYINRSIDTAIYSQRQYFFPEWAVEHSRNE